MDASALFAEYTAKTDYSNLPTSVISVTENILTDSLACMLAGSNNPITQRTYALFKEIGGREEATAFAGPSKLPAMHAALVNAVAGTCLDYNDLNEPSHTHIGISAVPAALALSEWLGEKVNGQDFLCALAVGMEIGCRLGRAAVKRVESQVMGGWVYCSLHAGIISAIVASKLMRLSAGQTRNAIGIAYHQAAGNGQAAFDGTDVRVLGAGFAARNGILSALLAAKGITGTQDSIDASELSLMNLYHRGEHPNILLHNLGTKFEILETGFKLYPCCGLGHRQLDALSEMMKQHDLHPDEIQSIELRVPELVYKQLCGEHTKKSPKNMSIAQFDLPWQLACLAITGQLGLTQFTDALFQSDEINEFRKRIIVQVDPSLTDETVPAEIHVLTQRGTFFRRTEARRGSPDKPFTYNDRRDKLLSCIGYGGQISVETGERMIETISSLKEMKSSPIDLLRLLPHKDNKLEEKV
ncbi:MAG: MmgE/PrpD family protein [Lachnospiraceae bacterium]|nr:MmgE/PrpD family protein [Lachnospiraceae bacterium]